MRELLFLAYRNMMEKKWDSLKTGRRLIDIKYLCSIYRKLACKTMLH